LVFSIALGLRSVFYSLIPYTSLHFALRPSLPAGLKSDVRSLLFLASSRSFHAKGSCSVPFCLESFRPPPPPRSQKNKPNSLWPDYLLLFFPLTLAGVPPPYLPPSTSPGYFLFLSLTFSVSFFVVLRFISLSFLVFFSHSFPISRPPTEPEENLSPHLPFVLSPGSLRRHARSRPRGEKMPSMLHRGPVLLAVVVCDFRPRAHCSSATRSSTFLLSFSFEYLPGRDFPVTSPHSFNMRTF